MSDRSPDVFLSYARLDVAAAEVVERALADAGVTVWRDVTGIQGGWYKERIVGGMKGAKVVLALCSPHSLASPNVAAELDLAWDDLKKPIVQVWVADRGGCDIPDRLAMQLSKASQFVPLAGRSQAEWAADLLRNLRVYGVGRRVGGPAAAPAARDTAGSSRNSPAAGVTRASAGVAAGGPRTDRLARPRQAAQLAAARAGGGGVLDERDRAELPPHPGRRVRVRPVRGRSGRRPALRGASDRPQTILAFDRAADAAGRAGVPRAGR